MACVGRDTGAESGAYKAKRGETPMMERPENDNGTSRKDFGKERDGGRVCGGGEF